MTTANPEKNLLRSKAFAYHFCSFNRWTDSSWKCSACSAKVVQRNVYTNLWNHIRTHRSDQVKPKFETVRKQFREGFDCMIMYSMVRAVHRWLGCVALNLQPLSLVQNTSSRKHMKLWSISRNTLVKYMKTFPKLGEPKITNMFQTALQCV